MDKELMEKARNVKAFFDGGAKDVTPVEQAMGEIISALMELVEAKEPEIYQHYKGGLYEYMATGQLESDGSDVVVYKYIADGQIWVRPEKDFHLKFLKKSGGGI